MDATTGVLGAATATNPWLGVASSLAGGLAQGLSAPSGPSQAYGKSDAIFDNSGWNVSFGSGAITSTSDKTNSSTGEMDNYLPYFALAIGAIVLWRMTRNKRP